jgi:hypothetical protein
VVRVWFVWYEYGVCACGVWCGECGVGVVCTVSVVCVWCGACVWCDCGVCGVWCMA